jgi:hypothetical protein
VSALNPVFLLVLDGTVIRNRFESAPEQMSFWHFSVRRRHGGFPSENAHST